MLKQFSKPGAILMLGLVLILAVAAYGFAAANTVPATRAGDGAGEVSGYTISNVHYNLDDNNPGNIDAVAFTVDTAPSARSTIKVQLDANGAWYTCTATGTSISCDTTSPQATALTATNLRVVIAD